MRGVATNQARFASGSPAYAYTPPSIPGPCCFFTSSLSYYYSSKVNAEMRQSNSITIISAATPTVQGFFECHALFREMGGCLSRVSKYSAVFLIPVIRPYTYHSRLHANNPSHPLYTLSHICHQSRSTPQFRSTFPLCAW